MYLLDPALNLGIETDASTIGIGARLFQYDKPDREYTIAYASRSLKGAERRYTITELEGLALVWCLRKWRVILMGRRVRVKTDHRALKFVSACAVASQRMARWLDFLQEFDLDIYHIPGKANTTADVLSRKPVRKRKQTERSKNWKQRRTNDDKSSSVSSNSNNANYEWDHEGRKRYAPRICLMAEPNEGEQIHDWINLIRDAQINDPLLIRLTTEFPEQYESRDGFIRMKGDDGSDRVTIPNNIAWELVDRIHRYLIHFGTDKVLEFTKRYFDMDNLDRITRDVVASCNLCMATKVYSRPTRGPEYYDLPRNIGEVASIDVYGPLPRSYDGNAYTLVIMDQYSKYTKMYPMRDQKLKTIERVLEEFYFHDIGRVPRTILSDCGGQFLAGRWKIFARRVGFKIRKTSPYNPQSNPVERVMRELGRALRAYACEDHRRWDEVIPRIEQVINATEHASTGVAPAVLEDREIDLVIGPPEILRPRNVNRIDRDRLLRTANERLRLSARKRRRQSEKYGTAKQYEAGDLV